MIETKPTVLKNWEAQIFSAWKMERIQRYPKNWKKKSLEVRNVARWRCQHCERQCRQPGESISDFIARTGYENSLVEEHPRRWSLQAAHLNHDPENENAELIALCLSCHRQYDNRQMAKIRALERERNGQLSVEQQSPKPLEGLQLPIADLVEPCGILNGENPNPVTPGTLVAWIEERLHLLSTVSDRRKYMQQLLKSSSQYMQALDALCKAIPYQYTKESLLIAISQVQQNLTASKDRGSASYSKRRHRLRGQASGFIEAREGNKSRRVPSVSYYYRWDSPIGRVTEYIPSAKLLFIEQLIQERTPAIDVLASLCAGKKKTTQRSKQLLQKVNKESGQTQLIP